ncbi:P-loop containing nucleoside triphosphate hydrolase protein [Trametes gibbosa]|nr:P-loop containing nucleoside triphosphate hydrolase protein [Trametes gibbosa]
MYRSLFKFGVFNAVQSQCYDIVMNTDDNMVTPTGSGKTVLFELAIIKMLKRSAVTTDRARCVYIAPTKSLCTEKSASWQNKFTTFGAKCSELTGDTVHAGRGAWGDAKDATIMYGEKWDSLTRNWQDHDHILSKIQLFLIDEVHLLNESRGSTLEVVVSRMKLRGNAVRFIVVSATVPNVIDVADWIANRANDGPATVKEFGEEFRPCKLSRFVYGVPRRRDTNDFVFAKALDYKLYGILQQHCNDKPVLVFCPTRKGVIVAAEHVLKEYEVAISKKETLPWSKPPRIEHVFSNKTLDKLATCGIGVHHAGLVREDRSATEQLYLKKHLKVLFATSTLAVGVNLPAHTVIIKGVKLFQNNSSQEYSDLDVMQMIGRAGRPQFDKEGVAIIMCEQELEAKYNALAQGQTVLESSLHLHLPEHLNSEIALGTITDMESAKEWLHNSFLYRRLQKNPGHYDIKKEGDRSWEERMGDLVGDSVKTLKKAEMVKSDEGDALSSTEYGDIMSKFYIRQATMTLILKLSDKATIREIVYNKLRTHNDIRYTIKKIEKPSDKVFILIQAILSAINLSDPEYKAGDTQPYTESIPILRHISRIARAAVEVAIMRKEGLLVKNALEVMRCLNAKAWEDRSVLAEHNVTTFAALRRMDPHLIESYLNRKAPFGHDLLASVNQLPQYTISISEIDNTIKEDGIEVELSIDCGLVRDIKAPKSKKIKKQRRWDLTMVLTLTSDNTFVDFRRISTAALKETKSFEVTAKLTKPSQTIIAYVTSALDMEGLEDIPGFWDMGEDDMPVENDAPLPPAKTEHATPSSKPYCICRDGLARPPPMTKKKVEMLMAADASPRKYDAVQLDHDDEQQQASKPKPRPAGGTKQASQSNRPLKKLEALHERMGVEKNLQLGDGGRIKLKHDLPSGSKPARKPIPKFDVEFSQIVDKPVASDDARDLVDFVSDSDSDEPEPASILDALRKPAPAKKPISSDSMDYANSEYDALIAGLPLDDGAIGAKKLETSKRSSRAEGFTLDTSLFDMMPSTPTLPERSSAPPAESSYGVPSWRTGAHAPVRGQVSKITLSNEKPQEPAKEAMDLDDPLAELEAWLQSGAVELEYEDRCE